jgi:hypothetical protein
VRAAEAVADRADLSEERLALQVVRAGQGLPRHRVEHRLEGYPVARAQQVARRRDVHPHPARLRRGVDAGQGVGGDDRAPASVKRVDVDDPPGDGDRAEPMIEHRRRALAAGCGNQREASGGEGQAPDTGAPGAAPAQQDRDGRGRQHRRDAEPERRLGPQREIECDAGAEEDREPEDTALGFGGHSLRQTTERPGTPCRRRVKSVAGDRDVRHRFSRFANLQDRLLARKWIGARPCCPRIKSGQRVYGVIEI